MWNKADLSMRDEVNAQNEGRSAAWYEAKYNDLLRESLRTVSSTTEIANQANLDLNAQTEQINRISNETDAISRNLDTSHYLIKGMKTWWGSMVQLFTNPPNVDGPLISSNSNIQRSQTTGPCDDERLEGLRSFTQNEEKINKPETVLQESRFDKDLTGLSDMLTDLHVKALEMGNTLNDHNAKLEHVRDKIQDNTLRMTKQKKDIDKMLN